MIELIAGAGVVVFAVYAGFNIAYLSSMRRLSGNAAAFLQNNKEGLQAVIADTKETMENVRKISGDVSDVTQDIRRLSAAVAEIEQDVERLRAYVKNDFAPAAGASIAGLRAGIKTGVVTLVKNLQEERGDDHERRA
jgi:K+/H+ antiporter YhaU regulatory subunit KhtT